MPWKKLSAWASDPKNAVMLKIQMADILVANFFMVLAFCLGSGLFHLPKREQIRPVTAKFKNARFQVSLGERH